MGKPGSFSKMRKSILFITKTARDNYKSIVLEARRRRLNLTNEEEELLGADAMSRINSIPKEEIIRYVNKCQVYPYECNEIQTWLK